jgi:hypothetical protein
MFCAQRRRLFWGPLVVTCFVSLVWGLAAPVYLVACTTSYQQLLQPAQPVYYNGIPATAAAVPQMQYIQPQVPQSMHYQQQCQPV